MATNTYYRQMYQRRNLLKEIILGLFYSISSYPKLSLEVFIRKNFGYRYFTLASAITVAVILTVLPVVMYKLFGMTTLYQNYGGVSGYGGYEAGEGRPSFWGKYLTWYLFLIGFIYCSVKRWKEVRRLNTLYGFGRFSLYSGDIDPRFFKMPFLKKTPATRQVEIFCEPALFFAIGIPLWLVGQSLGWLLVLGSIVYGISYAAMYKIGDDILWKEADNLRLNEDFEDVFVNEIDKSETSGVRLYFTKPSSKELRQKIGPKIFGVESEKDIAVAM